MQAPWWAGLLVIVLTGFGVAADPVPLDEPTDDARIYGVGMRVEVHGKVKTRGADNNDLELPLNVTATISYRERRLLGLGAGAENIRALREYEQAAVDIDIAEEKSTVKLPDPLKLMVTQGRNNGLETYSLGGLLSPQELELVTPPCDSVGFVALLPTKPVVVGDEWKPSPWVAQFLARLDATTASELTCRCVAIEGDVAKLSFRGNAKGAVQGTLSEVAFEGTVDFDLAQHCIVAASLTQTEKREVGAVSPGLDVAATVRILRKPAKLPGRLNDRQVLDVGGGLPPDGALLLRFESPWNLGLLHGRDWHLFQQTDQVAIFRLLDQGLFVAQCNLSPIPSAKPGEHTSEAVFKNDIQQSLGTKLKVLGAGETIPTTNGQYVYRITAEGAIADRPITWIYYLVADPSGRQASVLFAIDTPLLSKLGTRDRDFVAALTFGAPRTTSLLAPAASR